MTASAVSRAAVAPALFDPDSGDTDSPDEEELYLHDYRDWPRLIERSRRQRRPDPEHLLTPAQVARLSEADRDAYLRRLRSYNNSIGPLQTHDSKRVFETISALVDRNRSAPLNSRRWLGIWGPSLVGKSQCVTSAALRLAAREWEERGYTRRIGDVTFDYVPVLYIEGSEDPKSLLQAMLQALDVPYKERDSAARLRLRLLKLLPKFGTRLVIVDDVHLWHVVDDRSRKKTDFLKTLVTTMPVTWVFVSTDLTLTPLVRTGRGKATGSEAQLLKRKDELEIKLWNPRQATYKRAWQELLTSMQRRLCLGPSACSADLTSPEILDWLPEHIDFLPGAAIDWLKLAAEQFVGQREQLDRRTLERVRRPGY